MSVASLTASPAAGLLGLVARMLLAGGALAWVVGQAGPADSTAVIHVTEPDVVVSVDDDDYTIKGHCPAPIVVDLPAGDHTLVMRRGAETLHAEEFTLPRGKSIVLTAWASLSVDPAGRSLASFSSPRDVPLQPSTANIRATPAMFTSGSRPRPIAAR